MLRVVIPNIELFDEVTEEFVEVDGGILHLTHSLISISKWESKWQKPFLGKDAKTTEQTLDYIRCMTMNEVDLEIYKNIPDSIYKEIMEYIEDPMTATWINETPGQKKGKEVITSELIYYWMISLNIPMECQEWHLNRLITLIKVFNIKNQPPKKRSRKEMLAQRHALNQSRRNQFGTKG